LPWDTEGNDAQDSYTAVAAQNTCIKQCPHAMITCSTETCVLSSSKCCWCSDNKPCSEREVEWSTAAN